jgi:aspartate/methionine/tyrosine aminotransferase
MSNLQSDAKEIMGVGVPFIHDAAYYTHSYISQGTPLPAVGDVQIYSVSKMLGLSSLRVGYAVCPNPEFYRLIKEYMEAMTVGVSLPSQIFTFELMNRMRGYPQLVEKFENNSFFALQESKQLIKMVDSEVLEVPSNFEETPGMFLWAKKGAACDLDKAKINAIDGKHFGVPGYVRMNIAFRPEIIREIVSRLNSVLV